LDGLLLLTESWAVRPLDVEAVRATFFERIEGSAPGAVTLDNALIMRDVSHQWQALPRLRADAA
jgi:hypothetical protein